ncbi:hypothetical protein LXL04_038955 [Taraxacum kok-saghyz]
MYTAEAVAESVLRRNIPFVYCRTLTNWFSSGPGKARYRCIQYVLERAKLNFQVMNQLDMINRTSELARVFGVDFCRFFQEVPNTVANQPAMECLPLVMEPESGFYSDPVIVLDFQSLYPSMVIAYNLCFCTCIGKVTPSNPNTLGVTSYTPDPNVLKGLMHEILLTPNGVMYVPSKVRKGVLPRLLDEILSTRIMVKQAMKKLSPSDKVLHRIYNARQLALKLIANVTYGYTAAGFSGCMPCAELADSIVQCGRKTLETAISLVNTNEKWKAKVIYGDTDNMFVLLPERSVTEAFQIGNEIASAVTKMNPNPVVLKMEKVYHPCFLLTKKIYVGYSYEKVDQVKPIFDAKGIETVRRDTCGAVSKTMEHSLRNYFENQDISTYSSRVSSLPPAAIVATKAIKADPLAEPRYAEWIPYVVVHGEPGARVSDMVIDPLDLLAVDSRFRLNNLYYINKQIIPALQRVFGLVGADLNQWFLDMPKMVRESVGKNMGYGPNNSHRTRIDYYYLSKHCIMCGELVQASVSPLCGECARNEAAVVVAVTGRTCKMEKEMQHLAAICRECGGGDWVIESGVKCTSLACSVFYERRKVQKELRSLLSVATESGFYPNRHLFLLHWLFAICHKPSFLVAVMALTAFSTTEKATHNSQKFGFTLSPTNYGYWKALIQPSLVTNNLFGYIDGTIPCPESTKSTEKDTTPTTNPSYPAWLSNDAHIRMLLMSTISEAAFQHVEGTTPHDVWLSLDRAYAPHTSSREYTLKTQLLKIKMKGDESSGAYLTRAQEYSAALANIGKPMPETDLVMLVISGLREEYTGFKSTLLGRESPIAFNDLYGLFADHDYLIKKNTSPLAAAQAFAAATRHRPSSVPPETLQSLQKLVSQLGFQLQPTSPVTPVKFPFVKVKQL